MPTSRPLRLLAALLVLSVLVIVLVAATSASGRSGDDQVTATATTAPANWPGADTLAQDEAALAYAAQVEEARQAQLAVEWAAAAEANRVIEAQRAEEARQEAARAAQRRSTPTTQAQRPQASTQDSSGACGNLPERICRRESGFNPNAVNATGCSGRGCYGKYQFDPRTWDAAAASAGRHDLVGNYMPPEADQDAVANHLWAGGSGCSHWAACG